MSVEVPDWALELLREARVGRLATADAEARPLVVPVCYVFDGACCYSAIDSKPKRVGELSRLRNIAENPSVCLLVDHYEEDWEALRYVIVRGRAEVLMGGEEYSRAIDLLRAKYLQYRAMGLDRETGKVIKVACEEITRWRWK